MRSSSPDTPGLQTASTDPVRALSFDANADGYDRFRPRYPEALFADLALLTELPEDARVLEIGCGSGIATLPMVGRCRSLTCLEPGAELARIATHKLEKYSHCAVVESTFEDWPIERGRFDLVYSAQAFHWLDPTTRFESVASALNPTGNLAIFGHASLGTDDALRSALDRAYQRHAPALASSSPTSWYLPSGPIPDLFRESRLFADVTIRSYSWSTRYPTEDYVALLRTHSDHAMLAETDRRDLLHAISKEIEDAGGEIEIPYQSSLFVAKRLVFP